MSPREWRRRYPTPEEVRAMAVDPDADMTTDALECEGHLMLCDDWGCERAVRMGCPCPFRVTPRERALALGWRPCHPGVAWAHAEHDFFLATTVPDGSGRWRAKLPGLCAAILPTEDEALAHALLLRDVVLS